MMKIHLLLKKEDIDKQKMADNKIAVVFDVLLATSTITSALEFGAKEVIPVLDGKEAEKEAEDREKERFLLVGEYQGKTIDGFLSPNPLELREKIEGKSVILSTTNGTVALKNSSEAKAVYAVSLMNCKAVANHILKDYQGETIVVVCSGSSNEFNVEDFHGAGCFIDCLIKEYDKEFFLTDSAYAARCFYHAHNQNSDDILKDSRVGRMLSKHGFDQEIEFVSQQNVFATVPILIDRKRIIDAANDSVYKKGEESTSLKPEVKALLEAYAQNPVPPLEQLPLAEARKGFEQSAKLMSKAEKLANTKDFKIQGYKDEIKIRLYSPDGTDGTKLPAIVYYHGGGWVIGNIETHDALCHTLSNEAGCIVVSVDYSLAPESKFPVAVEDSYLAAKWVFENADEMNIDENFIAVAGDSAGGNLAAVVSYLAVQRQTPSIAYQMLFYPSTGFEYTPSYEKYGEGYYLTKSTMTWFREQYLNSPEDTQNPLAAPLLIPDEITPLLPPAYILTAELDPLCDGGEHFAAKLKNAGVETEYVCAPGMLHGFLGMTEYLPDGKEAIKAAAEAIKKRSALNPVE
ncbi:alpha/beta hydrolase fold domain-containing protein [Mesobacillus sp. AQ2]|uniref:alpha/beta hydrolase fold domain-containing protein n=1 Tax=Mesobacillus sp. AQ2 TaxID=3043332 RepID=UPI0024C0EFA9|nr:alpha/beta hydrolase fold domain-containing protein [Mesobacillus sp. AQ2]WHX38540.1 alpha/beta hydrolase fold domain-containing protein [Mesobacillus sp. AQ2]